MTEFACVCVCVCVCVTERGVRVLGYASVCVCVCVCVKREDAGLGEIGKRQQKRK